MARRLWRCAHGVHTRGVRTTSIHIDGSASCAAEIAAPLADLAAAGACHWLGSKTSLVAHPDHAKPPRRAAIRCNSPCRRAARKGGIAIRGSWEASPARYHQPRNAESPARHTTRRGFHGGQYLRGRPIATAPAPAPVPSPTPPRHPAPAPSAPGTSAPRSLSPGRTGHRAPACRRGRSGQIRERWRSETADRSARRGRIDQPHTDRGKLSGIEASPPRANRSGMRNLLSYVLVLVILLACASAWMMRDRNMASWSTIPYDPFP